MTTGKTIAKNASWLLMATTGQKLLAFAAFTIAARIVGADVTGEYFFTVAITSTFVILADLGLTPVVIRATAADPERGRRYLGAALRLKAALIPIAIAVSLVYAGLRDVNITVWQTLFFMIGVMSLDSIHLAFYGALRGTQKLFFEAVGMFVGQVLSTVVAVSAALLGWGAPGLAAALLIASAWNVGWSRFQMDRNGVSTLPASREDVRLVIRQAIPFALAGIFVKIYSYLDTMMIEAFHGTQAVGPYAVAYKVTYAFQFFPLVFVAALYPAMSGVFARGERKQLTDVFAGSLRLMAIGAAPIAAGISAIAPRFVPLFYGTEFLAAIPPLSILSWVLIPIFLDFPVGSLLNASHRAHLKTAAMGVAMVVNAALNLLLVPAYGPVGAAWAGVGSFSLLMVIGIAFARNDLPSLSWFASLLARSAAVGALMWIAIRTLGVSMPFAFDILFGGAVGVVGLLLARLLTFADVTSAVGWLRQRVAPSEDPEDEMLHG
jgi:O-antigen/teichoic acid export membrane protein